MKVPDSNKSGNTRQLNGIPLEMVQPAALIGRQGARLRFWVATLRVAVGVPRHKARWPSQYMCLVPLLVTGGHRNNRTSRCRTREVASRLAKP